MKEFVRHWNDLPRERGITRRGHARARQASRASCLASKAARNPGRVRAPSQIRPARLIVQAHPKFPEAFRDLKERWRPYAYGRHWFAFLDLSGITVCWSKKRKTARVQSTSTRQNPDLGHSIERLQEIQEIVTGIVTANPRSTDLFHAYPEFSEAFRDLTERWSHAYSDYENWGEDYFAPRSRSVFATF